MEDTCGDMGAMDIYAAERDGYELSSGGSRTNKMAGEERVDLLVGLVLT